MASRKCISCAKELKYYNQYYIDEHQDLCQKYFQYSIKQDWTCSFCKEKCFVQSALYQHIEENHLDDIKKKTKKDDSTVPSAKYEWIRCPFCSRKFLQVDKIGIHLENCQKYKNSPKIVPGQSCSICKIISSNSKQLEIHKYYKHSNGDNVNAQKMAKCSICEKIVSAQIFKSHEKECLKSLKYVTKNGVMFCQLCPKRFKVLKYLIHHMKSHSKEMESLENDFMQCTHCEMSYRTLNI